MRGHVEVHEDIMPENGSSAGKVGADYAGVLEEHHEGADSCSPLTSPAEGRLGNARAAGKAQRKDRTDNWPNDDTEQVIKVYAECRKRRRVGKFWEGVAGGLLGNTTEKWTALECRRRVETVKKAHNGMENYCKIHKMEVSEFIKQYEAGSLAIKLATRMTEDLFNLIHEECPPKRKTEQGDGSLPSPFDRNKAATSGHRSSTGGKHALANSGARQWIMELATTRQAIPGRAKGDELKRNLKLIQLWTARETTSMMRKVGNGEGRIMRQFRQKTRIGGGHVVQHQCAGADGGREAVYTPITTPQAPPTTSCGDLQYKYCTPEDGKVINNPSCAHGWYSHGSSLL